MDFSNQILGLGTGALKAVSFYLQSKYPDAKRIRFLQIPTFFIGALSFLPFGNFLGFTQYMTAVGRSGARATKWGTHHKDGVAIASLIPIACITTFQLNSSSTTLVDLLPLTGFILGTAADRSSQGRYQRLLLTTALIGPATLFAAAKGNYTLAAAEFCSSALILKGIIQHDIRNASGKNTNLKSVSEVFGKAVHALYSYIKKENRDFNQLKIAFNETHDFFSYKNLKNYFSIHAQDVCAYSYGIIFDAATGADQAAQVCSDIAKNNVELLYKEKVFNKPNPFYTPQTIELN